MIALQVADLVVIASRTLGLDTGRVLDLLDLAAVERALAQARPGSGTCRPGRPRRRAAARAGAAMDPDPPGPVAAMVTQLATGTLDTKDVANWLASRLRPGGRAAARVKEAPMRTRPKGIFTRFTDRARRVVALAQHEARGLGHGFVGTEHLLLGLLDEGHRTVAHVLADRGVDYDLARERVVALLTGRHEQADPKTRLVRLPVPAGLADVTEQLHHVQRQKTIAFEKGDLDGAAALRTREKQLRAEKLGLEHAWAAGVDVRAVIAENQRVHREFDRLRDLLRQHGIEPDGGTGWTEHTKSAST